MPTTTHSTQQSALVTCVVVLCLASFMERASTSSLLTPQQDALMLFYNATNGASWLTNTAWGNVTPPSSSVMAAECSWYGITCGRPNVVTEMDLRFNGLAGTLPANAFSNTSGSGLFALEVLRLSNNKLNGVLPSSISFLVNLSVFDVCTNELTGQPLPLFSTLTNLRTLTLCSNKLSGTLPAMSWASSLTVLSDVRLYGNSFSGTLPSEWSSLGRSLTIVWLSSNQLNGTLPDTWSYFSRCNTLQLDNNRFTGTLPDAWGGVGGESGNPSFPVLTNLALQSNRLEGTLPSWVQSRSSFQSLAT